jgi:tetratricopeptide (TPR) repeat protein
MHELEIRYFLEGLNCVKTNFFIDAIDKFKQIITEFPDSELVDDAEYNISRCYFELNQFETAIKNLESLIQNYPEGTITVLGAGNEFGRVVAKSYLLMINCYLALNQVEKTEEILKLLEPYDDSYIVIEGKEVSYFDLAKKAIDTYKRI